MGQEAHDDHPPEAQAVPGARPPAARSDGRAAPEGERAHGGPPAPGPALLEERGRRGPRHAGRRGKVRAGVRAERVDSVAATAGGEAAGDTPEGGGAADDPARPWIARAHEALARGDRDSARTAARLAQARAKAPAAIAEAETFLAECAQAGGEIEEAIRQYLRVSARFPALPAAEDALFAAMRLEGSRGHPADARRRAREYLARSPPAATRPRSSRSCRGWLMDALGPRTAPQSASRRTGNRPVPGALGGAWLEPDPDGG